MSTARSPGVGISEAREPRDLSPTEIDEGLPPAQLQRLARGLTEYLFVDTITPETDETGLAHVYSTEGKQYVIDVETGVYSCPDAEHNLDLDAGERCKHTYRAEVALGRRSLPPWAELDAVDDRLRNRLGPDG